MVKPVILAVDDDPQVLRAVERDLRRRYAREYRVLRADPGETALDALGTSSRIENYPGFPRGLSGGDLACRAVDQARRFGVEILTPQEVSGVRVEDPYRTVTLADGTVVPRAG